MRLAGDSTRYDAIVEWHYRENLKANLHDYNTFLTRTDNTPGFRRSCEMILDTELTIEDDYIAIRKVQTEFSIVWPTFV